MNRRKQAIALGLLIVTAPMMLGAGAFTGFRDGPAATATAPTEILSVKGESAGEAWRLHVASSRPVTHSLYTPSPFVVLVDLPNTRFAAGERVEQVQSSRVRSFKISNVGSDPPKPITRLEIHLASPSAVQIEETASGFTLHIRDIKSSNQKAEAEIKSTISALSRPVPVSENDKHVAPGKEISVAAVPKPPAVVPNAVKSLKPATRVDDVSSSTQGETAILKIVANGAARFRHFSMKDPDRVVVDLEGTILNGKTRRSEIGSDLVKEFRVGQYRDTNPPTVRLVVELKKPSAYRVEGEGREVVVSLNPEVKQVSSATAIPSKALLAAEVSHKPAAEEKKSEMSEKPTKADSARKSASELIKLSAEKKVESSAAQGPSKPMIKPVAQVAQSSLPKPAQKIETKAASVESAPPKPERAAADVSKHSGALIASAKPMVAAATVGPEPKTAIAKANSSPAGEVSAKQNPGTSLPPTEHSAPAPSAGTAPLPQSTTASAPAPTAQGGQAAGTQQMQLPPAQPRGETMTKPRYTGEPVSLNLRDVDIRDFFRLIHEISGLNIVLDQDVKGSLTIALEDTPWDQALEIVLKNNRLGQELQGNVLRIATIATLKKEEEDKKALLEAQSLAVELETITRTPSYARALDLVPIVKSFLTPNRGKVIADERSNTLIVSDIPRVIPVVDNLVRSLDRKSRQVEIEARVVSANRTFLRDLGTQLGIQAFDSNQKHIVGGIPGINSPVVRTPRPPVSSSVPPQPPTPVVDPITGRITIPPTSPGTGPIPLNTNFPATTATSGVSYLFTSGTLLLDAFITASESKGQAKLLSKPKLITQNNAQGLVEQGVQIPVQTVVNNTVTVQFIRFSLKLTVTPQITEEGTIFLDANVENSTPDFNRQVNGIPTINTQQAITKVLVSDGGTVIIGGVLVDQSSVNYRQVPGLGNVPIIGNLFKSKSTSTSTQELLFFITPKIVN